VCDGEDEPADFHETVAQTSAVTMDVSTTDPDGDALSYTLVSGTLPAGLTLNADGTITGTPAHNANDATITVRATDADGASVEYDVAITVENPGPVEPADFAETVTQGTAVNLDVSTTDPDGDALS